ncbi:type II toxin-antitoxin system PemK/MazF family toxin [Paracoccus sp. KR1-242]|uniref:type II toxin-antitoxin system PemK/MazF family toxin n=1 Tax=Paracoccus sp. KR1-242 TaxID=3410028 RepID=UPI003C0E4E09
MRGGDLVTLALQGDYGKPCPALIIQADQFDNLGSVVILPLTSILIDDRSSARR